MGTPAPPGEIHPFYEPYRQTITRWLQPGGALRHHHEILISRMLKASWNYELSELTTEIPEPWRLTRYKAWGAAPYVGRPFVYIWYVGVDQLGRQAAGKSRITYL